MPSDRATGATGMGADRCRQFTCRCRTAGSVSRAGTSSVFVPAGTARYAACGQVTAPVTAESHGKGTAATVASKTAGSPSHDGTKPRHHPNPTHSA